MTACARHIWGDPVGLLCTGEHHPAHTYEASDAPDAHTASEDRAEGARG